MKRRIEYIDALRGFVMLLVVMGHVEIFGIQNANSPIVKFVSLFHVPLFFFISGLMSAMSQQIGQYGKRIYNKFRQLIIPTLIIGCLFSCLHEGHTIKTFVTHPYKEGYWFTIALFQMFLLYYAFDYLSCRIGNRWSIKLKCIALIGIAAILYIAKVPCMRNSILFNLANIGSWHCLFLYFQFFVFGLVVAQYKSRFIKNISNSYLLIVFVAFLSLMYCRYEFISSRETSVVDLWKLLGTFMDTCCGYLGIVIVYLFFNKQENFFRSTNKFGRWLQVIGRHTIEIYLLHWFLLPELPALGNVFSKSSNLPLEIFVVSILTILIIGVCLFISQIVGMSRTCSMLLFGKIKS